MKKAIIELIDSSSEENLYKDRNCACCSNASTVIVKVGMDIMRMRQINVIPLCDKHKEELHNILR